MSSPAISSRPRPTILSSGARRAPASGARRAPASSAGFTLPEMLVASAVFMFVMLAAYQVFQRSQESYRLGQNQAEMVQAARVAFDQMTNDIRLSGFEFDVDGDKELYASQPDEPIEFMHRRAIVVRANFDFQKELRGREPGLERLDDITLCCPVVTTANEEIVAFALGKPSGTLPIGNIVFDADTTGTDDDEDLVIRDAYVNSAGTILNEETVTIANVLLDGPGDTGYAPPYTLYRFQINEDGTIFRQPLVDNVYALEFAYYDESDNEIIGPNVAGSQTLWGADDGTDKGVGRTERYAVRRVTVKVETLTPETDLRLKRVSTQTGVRNLEGKRLFTLEADMLPPNLGRRGARDRDVNPPEPPRNVTICTGQCRMVRVSWDPGPPEDKVADHVVTLCSGGPCLEDNSNRIGSFIRIANFDALAMKEYTVLTFEDDNEIMEGTEIWARVVARNAAGTESECPVPDCATCCQSTAGATVEERSRPDTFTSAIGGGYDPTSTDFPDARPANDGGMLIVTDPLSTAFPPSLVSQVAIDTPKFALNKAAGAGTAPYDWTTKNLGGEVAAALTCHLRESTPSDTNSDPRTPYDALRRDLGRGNTYVWRVSGDPGASSTWGGATAARNFVPTAGNLLNFTPLQIDAGTTTYTDGTEYNFETTVHGDRYNGYDTYDVKAIGTSQEPVQAVTPCEVYYYRFRATTTCWDDKPDTDLIPPAPSDGEDDDKSPVVRAWDTPATISDTAEYRRLVMGITPFYPPLLNAGDNPGQRDQPDPTTHDADNYSTAASVDTYATPSYALPQRFLDPITGEIDGWVKPEAPSEFYLTRTNSDGNQFMKSAGDPTLFDGRVLFNAGRRTDPGVGEGDKQPAAFRTYRLYRKAASGPVPASPEFDFDTAAPALVATFDTIAPNDVRRYTQAGKLEVPGPETGTGTLAFTEMIDLASDWAPGSPDFDCAQDPDLVPGGTTCIPYIYWLKTAQCVKFDDGIDTSSADTSVASRPFQFPCTLHYDVEEIVVTPLTQDTSPSTVTWQPVVTDDLGVLDCTALKAARLLAYNNATGDFIGASDWDTYEDGKAALCQQDVIPNPRVVEAVRGSAGPFRFVVEVSSSLDDREIDALATPIGCRVRSDYGPTGIEESGVIDVTTCPEASWCGLDAGLVADATGPNLFGRITDAEIQLTDNDTKMVIDVPVLGACGQSFGLRQLELKLEKTSLTGDNTIPDFISAQITQGVTTTYDLPAITDIDGNLLTDSCEIDLGSGFLDAGEDDAGEADVNGTDGVMVLRWHDAFCGKTADINDDPCACEFNYPTVLGSATTLRIELTFADSVCDVALTQFNFRVAIEDGLDRDGDGETIGELICSQRVQRPAEFGNDYRIEVALCPDLTLGDGPGGPAGADPDLPLDCEREGGWDGVGFAGTGRSGPVTPDVVCAACVEDCPPCQCPIGNDDSDPQQDVLWTVALFSDAPPARNPFGIPNTLLELEITQIPGNPGCTADCPFTIASIELEYRCIVDRDCGTELSPGTEPLGPILQDGMSAATLFHEDGTPVELGFDDPAEQQIDDPGFKRHVWNGLSIPLVNDETFRLQFLYNDSVDRSEITLLRVRFSQPFTAECDANGAVGSGFGPTCSNPGVICVGCP